MERLRGVGLMACALAGGACIHLTSHSCSFVNFPCDMTSVELQSPGNEWSKGMYNLSLNVDGRASTCTLMVPDPPPMGGIRGTCSEMDITWDLAQICPPPVTMCNATACSAFVSSSCVSNQFQMTVAVVQQGFGEDAASGIASRIAVDLSVDGKSLIHETVSPIATTTEPNGAGCGECTNASGTLYVAGR